jgi:predicted DNA-binding protein
MPTTPNGSRMKATLVRFGPDLYEELREEAACSGVSIAQYVREAVLARMAYSAGRRGDESYASATRQAAARIRAESGRVREESHALKAENRQARGQAEKVRERLRSGTAS